MKVIAAVIIIYGRIAQILFFAYNKIAIPIFVRVLHFPLSDLKNWVRGICTLNNRKVWKNRLHSRELHLILYIFSPF